MNADRSRYIESCPVGCTAPLLATGIVMPEGALLRCTECGQLVSQCGEAEYLRSLARWDTADGTLPAAGASTRHARICRRRLRRITRLIARAPHETRLLDVGCSSGAFLAVARDLGFRVEGVETSPLAAATARRAGCTIHEGELGNVGLPRATFDAVTLIELVEHLRDPLALLAECRRVLKPGGVLLVTTPNSTSWTARFMGARWDGFDLTAMGGHVSFFNPHSIRILARRGGFDPVRIETSSARLYQRGQCRDAVYIAAKAAAELLNWPARLFGKGHNLTVYLRR